MGVEGPFLVVAPLSTICNWQKEFNRFAPKLPVVRYHGSGKGREELRDAHLKEEIDIEVGYMFNFIFLRASENSIPLEITFQHQLRDHS